MEAIHKMKVKMAIQTRKAEDEMNRHAVIWEGELEIKDKDEYLMMISVIADGVPQPICQVPFSIGMGHYLWIPPDREYHEMLGKPEQEVLSNYGYRGSNRKR